mmetsp:Transcript_15164/g.25281  ORF Transcript_15164/g.25281 Transcript_15164/m.25281 type:complete len:165 (+) Transcript_15164:846-1340(+)
MLLLLLVPASCLSFNCLSFALSKHPIASLLGHKTQVRTQTFTHRHELFYRPPAVYAHIAPILISPLISPSIGTGGDAAALKYDMDYCNCTLVAVVSAAAAAAAVLPVPCVCCLFLPLLLRPTLFLIIVAVAVLDLAPSGFSVLETEAAAELPPTIALATCRYCW